MGMLRALLGGLLIVSALVRGTEQIVWQIGRADGDYAEFAIAGDYASYAAGLGARAPVFEVGRNDPGRDWPYIQPGPADRWAPNGGQPWTIRFELPDEPRGVWTLSLDFVDVHQAQPPRYAISLGERTGVFILRPGGGDDRSLAMARFGRPQHLEQTFPASFFRRGLNEIRLACTEGSWVQYDAITLRNDPEAQLPPPAIQSLTASAPPLFVRRDGRLGRLVDIAVTLSAPFAEAALVVEAAGQRTEPRLERASSLLGSFSAEAVVPVATEPFDVQVTALLGTQRQTTTVRVLPARQWRVFVAASAHTDIGYTDLQPNCAERHNQNTDTALRLMSEFPDFRWNLEVAWQAESYLQTRNPQQVAEFVRYANEGRLGVQALYGNILTGLCSAAEACRLTAFAYGLKRRYGIPYRSAMISDVPTQEASLPTLLAGAGIRYFSSGINNERAFTFTPWQSRSPCWWEGPDGSRVLMMYMRDYAQAASWGLDRSLAVARPRILEALVGFEKRADYPYDAVFLHGAVSDNCALNATLAEVSREWNARYEFPKIILCHNADFFAYIETQYGERLPVVRGSAGTYWEDGAGSSARETALYRNAHEALANGELFLALTARLGRPVPAAVDSVSKVWRNCLLYAEHTWGAYCAVSQPQSEFTKAQWQIKAQYAVDAAAGAQQVLEQGSRAVAALVRTSEPALVVLNPSSWPRTDVVQVTLPAGMAVAEPDVLTFLSAPGDVSLLVRDVPACGYRVLRLAAAAGTPMAFEPAPGTVIESRFYRVEFAAASGAIVSIRDKELDRELVDAQAPYGLNQYVYVAGGEGTRIVTNPSSPEPVLKISTSGTATLRRLGCPGVGEMMRVETSGPQAPRIVTTVCVWDAIKRIDISNLLSKELTYAKEGVYFAFPFAAREPTIRYEVPAGIVNANTDMLPGACLDWFAVQHFVEVGAADAAIAWATPDAPLVCFQDLNRGRWQTRLPMVNGHLYAYVMNNYWHTNYQAGQGGETRFRFAISSHDRADSVASARFGWGVSTALQAVPVLQPNPTGPLTAAAASLISVAEPQVIIIGSKQADEGQALIVRLWDVSGQATTAHLRLDPHLPATQATACSLVEEPLHPLSVLDGTVTVPLRGYGLATVRVE
jgi:hypothetical protein